ncbi:nuclear transport factor 2 family protein [Flavobacterium sp. LS1P28]|uniref:Nuclear transport factor 2 family protein n=1 Tax=Flavobacterium bomense TaxID=2497483 RepID=A0A432CLR8_9FLAO|nr:MULTISPECIES: nuclear transport factor 2 family protein [Flavobacterium]RTY65050.1 nuclear transport factor 2 family protein [Flavobacterium sp. LB2P53]RTY82128.1 nuclear transport factor 2 family protein [Flavobacterium sp. LS1P28]RTY84693.1 nuclear transport factor 2 family protein [Flavobacterium sp. ZB4P23]RTY91934.1 nuclear transport factor 2 family protein [Flavobacterium sp. RSP46]RTZ04120.1 nuclear transport factor 2 family protein [Flavobacterium bomense]
MTENEKILTKFYSAIANADSPTMCNCYDSSIQFRDPVFGLLKGNDVCLMWKMLLEKSKGNITIKFSAVKADDYIGSVQFIATYNFSKTNRKVVNRIQAQFQFKDGLIIKHTDDFDIFKWSKQAFGITGYLLGWTGFFHKKIQEQALLSLKKYKETQHAD